MEVSLIPGSVLQGGKYEICRTLGQGGFGITYLAEQVALHRKVAIKEFFMKEYCARDGATGVTLGATVGSRDLVERFLKKFLREAQMIASLDHPNIVKIHDVFEENGTAYYVMEFFEGESLMDKVKESGPLSEEEALRYIRQVARALSYIHKKNTLHFDVKPSNILINGDGDAVLIDFGVSKHYDAAGNQTSSTPVGISKGYAPLEQYQQNEIDTFTPATDIYALGATLYTLLTGEIPPSASEVNEDGVPEMSEKISRTTRNAIRQAMEPRRKDRPQSVDEFLSLLETREPDPLRSTPPANPSTAEDSTQIRVPEPEINPKTRENPAKKKSGIGLIVGGIVAALVLALFLFKPTQRKEADHESAETIQSAETLITTTPVPPADPVKPEPEAAAGRSSSAVTPTATSAAPTTTSAPKSSGSYSLPYGTYKGPLASGKPNGEGKVSVTKAYSLDNKSGKTYELEPGDYLDAEFKDGRLLNAYWYGSDGKKKGTIVIAQ